MLDMRFLTLVATVCVVFMDPSSADDVSTTTSTTTVTITVLERIKGTVPQSSHPVGTAARSSPVGIHVSTPTDTSSSVKPVQTRTASCNAPSSVCFRQAANKQSNLALACDGAEYSLQECTSGLSKGHGEDPMSNSTQRLCACRSQLFDAWSGCADCLEDHGCSVLDPKMVHNISSSYCAPSVTPSQDLLHVMMPLISAVHDAKEMQTVSNAMQGSTTVTHYFSPSTTGASALQATGTTASAKGLPSQAAAPSSHAVTPSSSPDAGNPSSGVRLCGAAVAAAIGLAAMALMV